MRSLADRIIARRRLVVIIYLIAAAVCAVLSQMVSINYNLMDYLPDDAASTKAINVLTDEYHQGLPGARVMVPDVTIPQALELKKKFEAVDGVEEVTWLDDAASLKVPIETLDKSLVEKYYKDKAAMFTVTVDDEKAKAAMNQVRGIAGPEASMSGIKVNTTFASETLLADIEKILFIAVPIIFLILMLTTTSWFEPVIFMVTIGIAILINMGTNIIFGQISFITKSVAAILQLAISMDYAIFLMHRFSEYRAKGLSVHEAMRTAMKRSFSSILSSGLATTIGFASLILMRIKIGPDAGWVMAKAIMISLISVFTFLPALTVMCYKLIDKTHHRSFVPDMKGFGRFVEKVKIPALILVCIITVPCVLATDKNDFIYFNIFSDARTSLGQQAQRIDNTFGEANVLVLMVEKGDLAKEKTVVDKINNIGNVSSVISYVGTVGAEIPTRYLEDSQLSQLISEHYSRMVITLNTAMEDSQTFAAIKKMRDIGQEYYPNGYHLAGESVTTYDMKDLVQEDNFRINLIAVLGILITLALTFRSLVSPVLLVLVIESAIWINTGIPYFVNDPVYYIGYLVIGAMQLGVTVDYAILYTKRYFEGRQTLGKREALSVTNSTAAISVFTSGIILVVAGFILGLISSNALLSQLGSLIARGTLLSLFTVLFVMPALLTLLDGVIQKTSMNTHFYSEKTAISKRKN